MAAMWSIHHPGLYLMKYFSMLPPEHMSEGIDKGYADDMYHPPARPQKTDFS
jgi:hypothetical protein